MSQPGDGKSPHSCQALTGTKFVASKNETISIDSVHQGRDWPLCHVVLQDHMLASKLGGLALSLSASSRTHSSYLSSRLCIWINLPLCLSHVSLPPKLTLTCFTKRLGQQQTRSECDNANRQDKQKQQQTINHR